LFCCRISELVREVETLQKSISERDASLARHEEQIGELRWKVGELERRGDELERLLVKTRAKNEELTRIKREIETVLVEQEHQVDTSLVSVYFVSILTVHVDSGKQTT